MEIKTSEIFAKVYNKVFRSILKHEYERYTFTGGRASTKSSFISLVIIILIVMFPKYNALIVRKYANTLRRSVFEQIVWAIQTLHLENKFTIPKSNTAALPIVYKKTGQMIIFAGCDDPEKIKSIKIRTGYFALLWFEEKTEFNENEISNVKLSAQRGGDVYYTFESFNPPASKRHWVNKEKRFNDSHRLCVHTTYLDIPKDWLGEALFHEAETIKSQNEDAYKNIFLGEETGTGQYVFENVKVRPITDDEINKFEWLYYGVDFGYYPDPFIWVAMSYDMKTETLYIFDELKLYKHGNYEVSKALEEHFGKVFENDFKKLKEALLKQNKPQVFEQKKQEYIAERFHDRITADSAEPKSIGDFRNYGWNMRGALKGKGSLETGFKWLQTRKAIVIDPDRCPEAADEFSLYEHELDRKTGEIMPGYPQGQADHAMAAVRYALECVWMKRGA